MMMTEYETLEVLFDETDPCSEIEIDAEIFEAICKEE